MAEASAPASSANLGPGFDCVALALEIRCRVSAEPADSWTIDHANDHKPDGDSDDAVLAAAQAAVDRPLRLIVDNDIPISRGLGSSAAAFAAGALAAYRATGSEPSQQKLFELCARLEGHPDNAAAAVYGGLILTTGGEPHRLPWNPIWRPVLAVPSDPLRTSEARGVLPPAYPAEVVIRSIERMGALMAGLLGGDREVLASAGGDELHEAPRRQVRPETADLIRVARASGAAHAAWSGAGPAVIALVSSEHFDSVCNALRHRLADRGTVLTPDVSSRGAV